MRGEKARTEEHLRGCLNSNAVGTSYKYTRVILMKTPNIEQERTPTGHLLSPSEVSSAKTGFNPTELLAKGVL